MAFKTKGDLSEDLLQIEIDGLGQQVYNDMPKASREKIKKKCIDQMEAIKSWMTRQTLNITNLEAAGTVKPGGIQVQGTPTAQANTGFVNIDVQISDRSNKHGRKEVNQNVNTTKVEALTVKN